MQIFDLARFLLMFLYLFEHLIEFGCLVIGYLLCILNCVIFVLDMSLILTLSLILYRVRSWSLSWALEPKSLALPHKSLLTTLAHSELWE